MRVRIWVTVLGVVGVTLLVTGAVLWWGGTGEATFGWFAYAPLSDETSPGVVVVTGRQQAALVVGAAAVVLLTALAGFAVGRRSRRGQAA